MDEIKRHALMTKDAFTPGVRVKICARHLRSTGQFYGDPAPTNHGPFARGEIVKMDSEYLPGRSVALIRWDNGQEHRVLTSNLWPCGRPEPA